MSVRFDPFAASVHTDPYPTYKLLREEAPVYEDTTHAFWALSRFADVQAAARDWRTFSNAGGVDLDVPAQFFGRGDFLDSDPPRHDELRDAVRGVFTPRSIQALEAEIEKEVALLLAALLADGGGDLAQDFAWELPLRVICGLIGFPPSDRDYLGQAVRALLDRTPDQEAVPPGVFAARERLQQYIAAQADDRRRCPRRDLLTVIVEASAGGTLVEEEVVGVVLLLLIAGIETTASLISNSIVLMAEHPAQRRLLADDPGLLRRGVEELLRFDAPIQFLKRTTIVPVQLHGITIPREATVLLLYGSANRDHRRFPNPDRLDVAREPKRHLAFGEGIHFCLGAPLARLEARIALGALLARIETYTVLPGMVRTQHHHTRGVAHLPVEFHSGVRSTAQT